MAHTILIVDDSPTAVPELKAVLESLGYQVMTALRGEEALDTLRSAKVDLVVTEALLPGMDGFELVQRIRMEPGWGHLPILMLTVRSAPEDYAASFEAGANEYFLKPADTTQVTAAVRGLLARYEMGKLERPGSGRGGGTALARSERGEIITVFSLKGGVGTTTIAVNLAVAIKELAPSARVGLIDLSLEQGLCSLLLDIVPTSTIHDWARENLEEANSYLLNQYFVPHRTGISLMSAPLSPEQAEAVRPPVVRVTLDLAPQAFDYIVVDTSSSFNENTLLALEMAQTIVLPVTSDMASMRTAVHTMRILKAVNIDQDRTRFVRNEIVPKAGLTKEQLESGLGKDFVTIPHAGSLFIEASNQGIPIVSVQPTLPAARAIIALARSLCVAEVEEVPLTPALAGSGLKGRLDRLQRLRRT